MGTVLSFPPQNPFWVKGTPCSLIPQRIMLDFIEVPVCYIMGHSVLSIFCCLLLICLTFKKKYLKTWLPPLPPQKNKCWNCLRWVWQCWGTCSSCFLLLKNTSMAMSGTYTARRALTFPASTANRRESLLMADSRGVRARRELEEYGSTGPDQLSKRIRKGHKIAIRMHN